MNAGQTLRHTIDRRAKEHPAAPFLIAPEGELVATSGDLRRRCRMVASGLAERGLAVGDRVGILLENGVFTAELFLGCMYGGFVPTPMSPAASGQEIAWILEHSGARLCFAARDEGRRIRRASPGAAPTIVAAEPDRALDWEDGGMSLPEVSSGAPAVLDYTSGSTGRPKGVLITQGAILAGAGNTVRAHALEPRDRSLCVLPLWHLNAQVVTLLATLASGGSVVMPRRFVARDFWRWVVERECTWSGLVPTFVAELLAAEDPPDLGRLGALRFARCSSAPLSPELHREFERRFGVVLLEAMGATEAGSSIFSAPLPPAVRKVGSPGVAVGHEVRIVSPSGDDLPHGEEGEIVIRGPSVMKEYFRDPDATARVLDAGGWLRTGDVGLLDADGFVFVTGRIAQFILRGGERIAPREVEEAFLRHPAVQEACAVGVPDRVLGEEIAVHVVPVPGALPSVSDLRQHCRRELGEGKTPAHIFLAEALPKGGAAKVQRRTLAELAAKRIADLPRASARPREQVELALMKIWREELGLDGVGADEDFFALGGTSLDAMRILSRARDDLGIEVPVSLLLEEPTISGLAERLSGFAARESGPISDPGPPYPLSPVQERIWLLSKLHPEIPRYNEAHAVRVHGPLVADALARALSALVRRHEVLRTRYREEAGAPLGEVAAPEGFDLAVVDASAQSDLDRILAEEVRRRFDLDRDLPFRATLFRSSPTEHVLLLVLHHVACDRSSLGILWRELEALYGAELRGGPAGLPPQRLSYGALAARQRERLASDPTITADLEYWKTRLGGAAPLLGLPSDRPRPQLASYRGSRIEVSVSGELAGRLRQLARERRTSPFTIVAAALHVLLARVARRPDVVFGVAVTNRDRREARDVVGPLFDSLPLRVCTDDDPPFVELLARTAEALRELRAHGSVPFERIVATLEPERSLAHEPLFQVLLNWRDPTAGPQAAKLADLEVEPIAVHNGCAKLDLTLSFADRGSGSIEGNVEFASDLFDVDTARGLGRRLSRLLASIVDDPKERVSRLSLLDDDEGARVLEAAEGPPAPPGTPLLRDLVARQAGRDPRASAVVCRGSSLTYGQLMSRATNVAAWIARGASGPEAKVGLLFERSADAIVALLGVFEAGAACVPLDPSHPDRRLASIAATAGLDAIVVDRALAERAPASAGRRLVLGDERVGAPRPRPSSPDDLAYVLFTSGSTGTPKGVAMPHRAIANLVRWQLGDAAIGAEDRILHFASLGFDVAFQEIFSALAAGATMVIASEEERRDPRELLDTLVRERITVAFLPVAVLELLAETVIARGPYPLELRRVITAGEALRVTPAIRGLFRAIPTASLQNQYGPTETHVVTFFTLGGDPRDWPERPPIGAPIPGAVVHVLEPSMAPAPVGVPGEIWIGGDCLARGYQGRPDLTAERFVEGGAPQGKRLYRTGDLGRLLRSGALEFLGRVDRQVKIRGHRVEPEEVEAVLAEHPTVREVAVVPAGRADGGLVAYFAGDEVTGGGLRAHATERLPPYMVPERFVPVDRLPRTTSGKVDRGALPQAESTVEGAPPYEAPASATERTLAAVWSEVLGIERVGREDDFFARGGHSLAAARVGARLRERLGRDVPLREIFERPRLRELAARLEKSPGALVPPPIREVEREGPLPTSIFQEWILRDGAFPAAEARHLVIRAFTLAGPPDREALRRALAEIVRRHEILRTCYRESDGGAVQVVQTAPPLPFDERCERVHSAGEADEIRLDELRRPFDLVREIPFRARLVRIAGERHLLVLTFHHIAADAGSFRIFFHELDVLYRAFAAGARSPLPEPRLQYGDFAVWQRAWLRRGGPRHEECIGYWRDRLADPLAPLEAAFACDAGRDGAGRGDELFEIAPAVCERLEQLAHREQATLFSAILAALGAAAVKIGGRDRFFVTTYVDSRSDVALDDVIGYFVSPVIVTIDLSGDPRFEEAVARTGAAITAAHSHANLPYSEVWDVLRREGLEPPPLQSVVQMVDSRPAAPRLGDLVLEPAPGVLDPPSQFHWTLRRIGGAVAGTVHWNRERHDLRKLERWLFTCRRILESACEHPGRRISALAAGEVAG
jgi:amino acid adenylation domain-containing protein